MNAHIINFIYRILACKKLSIYKFTKLIGLNPLILIQRCFEFDDLRFNLFNKLNGNAHFQTNNVFTCLKQDLKSISRKSNACGFCVL